MICSIRLVLCTATKLIAKSLLVSTEPPQCNICFRSGCTPLCSKRKTSTSLSCVLHLQLLLEKWSCCWSCKSTVLTSCPWFCCHGYKSAVCVTALSYHTIFIALGALTDDLCCGIQCLEVCLLFAPLPQLYPTWVIKRIIPSSNPTSFIPLGHRFCNAWCYDNTFVTTAAFPCDAAQWHSNKA